MSPCSKKLALAFDDGLRHAQDGFETLLQILDEPARLLQLSGHFLRVLLVALLQDVGVNLIDAQARHGFRIQACAPDAAVAFHQHIRHDIVGGALLERRPGLGFMHDQVLCARKSSSAQRKFF